MPHKHVIACAIFIARRVSSKGRTYEFLNADIGSLETANPYMLVLSAIKINV